MHLVSTGKATVLSDFHDLKTKAIYHHNNGETTDFQFYAQQRIFVEVNKKSGLEIMRIKEKTNQKMDIQRVRKLTIENVYCVACAKQSVEDMALGLSNGQVKLYNYKNSQFVHRFNAENIRNSVLYLDYNASDEYMSAVFENGQINIYGIKTKTKMDTINIDGNSTLARFHPTKRFHLSVASYTGCVSIYDMHTKRKLLHTPESHTAPCRDLCMSIAAPDTLVSVGYDCVINIFDTRRKTQPIKLTYTHPLSTVAMTDCGTYFCVGSLKGELIMYDMRNTKSQLVTQKVHDCAVTRIAFVPSVGDNNTTSFSSTGNQTGNATAVDSSKPVECFSSAGDNAALNQRKSVAGNAKNRDSFCDFLDLQANKGQDKLTATRLATTHRDSFDWEALMRKPSKDSNRGSLFQTSTGKNSIGSANNSSVNSNCDSFDAKLNSAELNAKATDDAHNLAPLRDRSNTPALRNSISKLMQIQEEQSLVEQKPDSSCGSDKENPHIELDFCGSHLPILAADRNSTPNRVSNSLVGGSSSNAKPIKTTTSAAKQASSENVAQQIIDLRAEMNTRFQQLEFAIKFNAENNKWQMFTQAANMWNQQIDSTEEIRDALGILLQTDPFVSEFLRLKAENDELRAQLQQMSERQ